MIVALLALALATGHGTRIDSDLPPPRYQGDVTAVVHFVDDDVVQKQCGKGNPKLPSNLEWGGCQLPDGSLMLPNPCRYSSGQGFGHDTCHEIGHANGWPANHPF